MIPVGGRRPTASYAMPLERGTRPTLTVAAAMLEVMSEADLQKRVTDYADLLGLRWHHEVDSRKSKAGFPDLLLAGPGGVVYAELKTERGKIRREQVEWIADLRDAGQVAVVWRPSDWSTIAQTIQVLARRPRPGALRLSEVALPESAR